MTLSPCLGCGRHVRARDRVCPFCGALERGARSALAIAVVGGSLALAACRNEQAALYGGPPPRVPVETVETAPPEQPTATQAGEQPEDEARGRKVAQCNLFIDRANQTQGLLNGLDFDRQLEDQARALDAEAAAITQVKLEDATLVRYRDEYAQIVSSLATVMRDLGALQGSTARASDLQASAEKLTATGDALERRQSALVDAVNGYCTEATDQSP